MQPRPIAELVGDERFDDPFRHLEGTDAAVESWQAEQDTEARAYLAGIQELPMLTRALERELRACGDPPPVRAGELWLRVAPITNGAGPALRVANDPGAVGDVLFSAGDLLAGPDPEIDWFAPSPDSAWVAVGVSCRGDERSSLHFVNVRTGAAADARVQHVSPLAWSPDSSGGYCLAGSAAEPHGHKELIHVGPRLEAHALLTPPGYPRARDWLQLSGDGLHIGLGDAPSAPRLRFVLDVASGEWRDVAGAGDSETFAGLFLDGHYYAVTTVDAPRGRLIRVPVPALADRSAWQEVVPQREAVLRAVACMADVLVLCSFVDGASQLELLSLSGQPLGSVPLSGAGVVTTDPRDPSQYGSVPPLHADAEGLTFSFSQLDRSPILMRYEASSGALRSLGRSRIVRSDIQVEHLCARSGDGADVRYDVVSSAATSQPAPRPVLVVAYGGWNAISSAKAYLGTLSPFVDSGGSVVFAHVRGDATFGADQWRAGRREFKQRSFDDVYAVVEDLLERGIAITERLALYGASNGGLLVGAAITQRPQLFRAAVAVVPLLDMCRFPVDRFGEHCTWEYGDPRRPDAAAWLRRYSPYHNVRKGVRYPATLLICGECDVRTPAWHGRKMLAALREGDRAGGPILLRVHEARGHTSTSNANAAIVTEWLGFVMSMVGLRLGTRD